MKIVEYKSYKTLLLRILILTAICVLIFNVFYSPEYSRYIQVNYVNSILFVIFLILILYYGIILGNSNKNIEIKKNRLNKLTSREKEIIQLIIKRNKNIEIANELFVELSTIKSHINNIYKKENVNNREELIEKYSQLTEQIKI